MYPKSNRILIPQNAHGVLLAQLPFTVRLQNILSKLGYKFLGDLHEVTYDHILKKYSCGLKTIKELEEFVTNLGFGEIENTNVLKREFISIPHNAADWPLALMNFSARLNRVLKEMGIVRLDDLKGITYEEILAFPSCGEKSISELKSFIKRLKAGEITAPQVVEPKSETIFIPQHARGWSLMQLPISNRLANVLNDMGFRILSDLHGVSYREVLSIKNSGRKSVAELEELVGRLQGGEFDFAGVNDEGAALSYLVRSIDSTLEKLPLRERNIFLLRFGGTGEQPTTLRDIGDKFDVTHERIRQIINNLLKHIRMNGGPILSDSMKRISEKCISEICPLTPQLFAQWLEPIATKAQYPGAFYFRLISEMAPDIPIWLEGHKAESSLIGEYRDAKIVFQLREIFLSNPDITSLSLSDAFNLLKARRKIADLEAREFLDALEISNTFTIDLTSAHKPQIRFEKLGLRGWAKRVLAQSERPLTPEEIIDRAQAVFNHEIKNSPFSISNTLKPEDGFYLLDRRAYGLRKHFQLPERLYKTVLIDVFNLLKAQNRPISTSEIVNKQEFEWANLTNSYELAQILREDTRFTYLGRFLFALSEWGVEEREYIKDLIPKVLSKAACPMTSTKIGEELQRFRSVSPTSIAYIVKNTPHVSDYGFGYYGLDSWGETAKKFLVSQFGFVNRAILLSEPPLTFGQLCQTLRIPLEGELADHLWRTIRNLRKVTVQPSVQSPTSFLNHESWDLERALYALLAKESEPKQVYEIQWDLKDHFGSGFGDKSIAEIEHCLEQSHLFIRNPTGAYIIDKHLENSGVDASSIRQMCLDILSNCNEIVDCDNLMDRLEAEGMELENVSDDMLAAILRGSERFEEVGTSRFRLR